MSAPAEKSAGMSPRQWARFSADWLLATAEYGNASHVVFGGDPPERRGDADARLRRVSGALDRLFWQLQGYGGPETLYVGSKRQRGQQSPRRRKSPESKPRRELPPGFRVIDGGAR